MDVQSLFGTNSGLLNRYVNPLISSRLNVHDLVFFFCSFGRELLTGVNVVEPDIHRFAQGS